jgi:putative chitinase
MELAKKYKTTLNDAGIDTPLVLAHFFTQLDAESGFKPKRESLYYKSIKGLRYTFKSPFKGKSDAFVSQYLRNTKKCANYVYANRMGNGDEASGDGFKHRGAGFLQHTGFDEFYKMSIANGIDLLENPELLKDEMYAMVCACWYWKVNNLNKYAHIDDLDGVSDMINIGRKTIKQGDANGFLHRKKLLTKWKIHFNV